MSQQLFIFGVTYQQINGSRKVHVVTTEEQLDELATFANDINFRQLSRKPTKIPANEKQYETAKNQDFRALFEE